MTTTPDDAANPPGLSRARQGGAATPLGAGTRPAGPTAPPSFAPSGGAPRPDQRGARPVGRPGTGTPATGTPSTAVPARSVTPQRTAPRPGANATPPSAAPTRPAVHVAQPVRENSTARAAAAPAPGSTAPRPPSRATVRRRRLAAGLALVLVLLLAWPIGLLVWANGKVQHVDAISDAPGTPARVYLLAGSDSRADGAIPDGTQGQRTDTIMLLTVPSSGTTSLISLPRDTYVDIPGHGPGKLNASFSYGGAPLLVQTVEQLTGMKVDHYVEIGMAGVEQLVDAVGGVELCLDYDVDDPNSELVWTAGCHVVDGRTALAFSRMRYSDPLGDIGRTQRQQQLISAVSHQVATPSTVLSPARQVDLIRAGTGVLVVDQETGIVDLARMAVAFRAATGPSGVRGTPPIGDNDYRPGGLGSTVLLDEAALPPFLQQVQDGTLPPASAGTEGPPN